MGAFLRWVVARRLLTLAGFGVILLGAFVPWPNLAIAAAVIVLGAVLLAVQIPIAMRDASEQLDGFDQPEEQWQSATYAPYEPPAPFQPEASSQPQPYAQPYQQPRPSLEPAPVWQPQNIRQPQPEPSRGPSEEPAAPAPAWKLGEAAPAWRPKNIPQH
ncbi:MAG: hypothetical protein JOZ75_01095 [Candidatus Dormibacteraeota bacterium]|nr:hypothetical protein [Candidatus Dormibacteraeota bacterium]